MLQEDGGPNKIFFTFLFCDQAMAIHFLQDVGLRCGPQVLIFKRVFVGDVEGRLVGLSVPSPGPSSMALSCVFIFMLKFGTSFYFHILLIMSFLQFHPSQLRLSLPPSESPSPSFPLRHTTNAQLSSATASLPLRHTSSHGNHGNIPVADCSCVGSHLGSTIRHSIHFIHIHLILLHK
jgi:hypothetical protein